MKTCRAGRLEANSGDLCMSESNQTEQSPVHARFAAIQRIKADLALWRDEGAGLANSSKREAALSAFRLQSRRHLPSHLEPLVEKPEWTPEERLAILMELAHAPLDLRGTWAALHAEEDCEIMPLCLQACTEELARDRELEEKEGEGEECFLSRYRPQSAVQYSFGRLDAEDSEALAATLTHAVRIARLGPDKAARFEPQTLRILPTIGDADSSEGRRIVRTYAGLAEPLPLCGSQVVENHRSAGEALRLEFPWLETAVSRVVDELALMTYTGQPWFRLQPLLLVGPPGAGKTRFAQRLAQLAQVGFAGISVAGSTDNRSLMGTARGWAGAQPALPLLTMLQSNCANPLCLVDEVEKGTVNSHNGSVVNALHTFLEPQSAASFHDECLLAACDLSQVSWVLTANSLKGLPDSLLSRLSVVQVAAPGPADFDALYHSIQRDLASELRCSLAELPDILPAARESLRAGFTAHGDVRRLKRAMRGAISTVADIAPRALH